MSRNDDPNTPKVESTQAHLETVIGFADLMLKCDNEREAIRYKRKAYDAYEDALCLPKTAELTHIEWESIKRT